MYRVFFLLVFVQLSCALYSDSSIKIFGADENKSENFNGRRSSQALIDAAFSALREKVNTQQGSKGSGRSSGSEVRMKRNVDSTTTYLRYVHSQFWGDAKDVIKLTDSNFDSVMLGSKDNWLILFYAPWCIHSEKLAPHWAKAATELKGKVELGALDATVNTIKSKQFGIQRYPTIKFFCAGEKTASSAKDYDGAHTSNDIVSWAMRQ